jgi:PAS domain S-box-containing protein
MQDVRRPQLDGISADSALLRRVTDKLPSMLAYWDSTQHCRFANRAYETWFGVSPESLVGTHISKLLGPLYRMNLPHIEAALRGEPQEFEREIPDPAGGPSRHSLAHYIPDVVGGVVRGFIAHVTDISQLKRTELALRTSEAKFSGIISIAQDAIITIDEDQRISIFNAGAEQVFGYASSEILGAPIDLLIPPRHREAHRQHVRAFADDPHAVSRRMHGTQPAFGLRKNGEEFRAEGSIS